MKGIIIERWTRYLSFLTLVAARLKEYKRLYQSLPPLHIDFSSDDQRRCRIHHSSYLGVKVDCLLLLIVVIARIVRCAISVSIIL